MQEERALIVGTVREAAHTGYDQGFREGYQAACLVVETLAQAEKEGGWLYGADGILKALEMSREKAVEMLGTPRFEVTPVRIHPGTDTMN